jgi:hypothetical protein
MQFARKVLLVLVGAILPLLLFTTAFDFGILRVVGSPGPIKKLLSDSGIYNSVVSGSLDQAQQSAPDSNEVALTNQEVKKAAEETFSPQVIQNSSEKVIDGIYDWLNGKSSQPDFNVDLTDVKTSFAEKVGQAAEQRAATLPICTSVPETTDPFNATCLPPSVTPAQVGQQTKKNVLTAQGFLEHPTLTADSIKNSEGQPVFSSAKLQDAPKQYQRAKVSPYILATLSLLAILAIVFLSFSRKAGLRRAGITLALAGTFMLLFSWGSNRVVTHNIIPKLGFDNNVLKNNVQKLATDIVHSIGQNYLLFGCIYLVLGLAAIAASMAVGRGSKKTAVPVPAPPAHTPPPSQAPPPKEAPKRPKTPPRIQG